MYEGAGMSDELLIALQGLQNIDRALSVKERVKRRLECIRHDAWSSGIRLTVRVTTGNINEGAFDTEYLDRDQGGESPFVKAVRLVGWGDGQDECQ